jgi:hypothetical protein
MINATKFCRALFLHVSGISEFGIYQRVVGSGGLDG